MEFQEKMLLRFTDLYPVDSKKILKLIYSEKATKSSPYFWLQYILTVKSKGKISKKIVAFSEYINFTYDVDVSWNG